MKNDEVIDYLTTALSAQNPPACKLCSKLPEYENNGRMSILRCAGCHRPARGFINSSCMKEPADIAKSHGILYDSWIARNIV